MGWFSLLTWMLRIGMIPLVAYRRRLTSALSWLALIFLVPWIAAPLYLFLAEHRLTRRVRRHRRVLESVRTEEHLAFERVHRTPPRLHGESALLSRLSDRLGGFSVLAGNAVEVLDGDDRAIDRLVDDIDAATDHVHVLFYIIEDDDTGHRVCDALQRAAGRGVTCRVLADAVGSRRFHRRIAPSLRDAGIDVRKMLPMHLLLRRLRPLDVRNHRKLVVIDAETAYTGSMNLVDYDAQSGGERPPWRDVLLRLRGPVVQQFQLVFHEDWAYNTEGPLGEGTLRLDPPAVGEVPAQVVPSGPTSRVETIHNLMVAALNAAQDRVVITTPYFIPDEPTRIALRLAALRGVRVDVIVPKRGDSRFVALAGQAYYEEFLEEDIHLHEHSPGFLHAKTMTVDGEFAMVGSANFDRRSFFLNFELNVLLFGETAVWPVVNLQERYLVDTRAVQLEAWRERPLPRRVLEDVTRLLSPLL